MTCSNVFAEADQAAGDNAKELFLSDPELEHSDVIDKFLDLAVNASLPELEKPVNADKELRYCQGMVKVLTFIHKYDCDPLLRLLRLVLFERFSKGAITPHVAFVIGSAANDLDICSLAITKLGKTCIGEFDQMRNKWASCSGDPGTLPVDLWISIPSEWAWAWSVGWMKGCGYDEHCNSRKHHTLERVVTEFRRAVDGLVLKRG